MNRYIKGKPSSKNSGRGFFAGVLLLGLLVDDPLFLHIIAVYNADDV